MCLNGSLVDLAIQDVLQILSIGRKSGDLLLETPAGVGVLVFRKGRVVASIEDRGPALTSRVPSFSGSEREALICERITAFVQRLARCRRGEFSFKASMQSSWVTLGGDVAGEALGSGIDVIELLVEIAWRQDHEEREATHAGPRRGSRVVPVEHRESAGYRYRDSITPR